jgi:hypothetical protein
MRSVGLNPTQKEIADAIDEMDKNGKGCSVMVSMRTVF